MKILGIAGTSRAGKSTLADFVIGSQLCLMEMIDQFHNGETLEVLGDVVDEAGNYKGQEMRPFDHRNIYEDKEKSRWLEEFVWPHIKVYSLAKPLKDTCISLFGLTHNQCYFEKDSQTNVSRQKMAQYCQVPDGPEFLTAREVLVYFGSGICRGLINTCFIDSLVRQIQRDQPEIAIIDDVRQEFEAAAIHKLGGQVIKLTRGEPLGLAESSFNDIEADLVIDNKEMTLWEKNEAAMEFVKGFLENA
jgi:hypothetical protein